MADITKDDIIEYLKTATIIDVNDLVKAIEEEFGITAAAPVAVAAAPAAGGADAGGEDSGPTEVSVVLTGAGDKKIQVIKVVREITGLGLKEAKDVVDNPGKPIKEGIPADEAEQLKAKLEEAGASVEIK